MLRTALKFSAVYNIALSRGDQLLKDPAPIVPMSEYVPTEVPPNAGYYYPKNFRILNCWQCFEAKGKICIDEDQGNLFSHTGSSVVGNAFCCKQDYNEDYCKSGEEHTHEKSGDDHTIKTVCSPPSFVPDKSGTHADVLTGDRNFQFFAFCPGVNQNKCGVPGVKTELDHHLKAIVDRKSVEAKDIHYRPQNPPSVGSE